jgi:hypothetical protein
MKRKIYFGYLFILIFCYGCNSYKYLTIEKNHTVYSFNANIPQVKKAIRLKFEKRGFRDMGYCVFEDNNPFAENTFQDKENLNDAYLYSHDTIGKSYIYHNRKGGLWYWASFHIHIQTINDSLTKVEIRTIKPKVKTGLQLKPGDNFSLFGYKYKEVPPSTVEEYQILLMIGEALGEKNMPALKLPNK